MKLEPNFFVLPWRMIFCFLLSKLGHFTVKAFFFFSYKHTSLTTKIEKIFFVKIDFFSVFVLGIVKAKTLEDRKTNFPVWTMISISGQTFIRFSISLL